MTKATQTKSAWRKIKVNKKWIINTTDKCIPKEIERLLQMGPKFAIKPQRIPIEPIITDLEYTIRQAKVSDEQKNETRQKIASHLRRTRTFRYTRQEKDLVGLN